MTRLGRLRMISGDLFTNVELLVSAYKPASKIIEQMQAKDMKPET
jgi:hypothetical protein